MSSSTFDAGVNNDDSSEGNHRLRAPSQRGSCSRAAPAFPTNCLGPGPRLYGYTARCLARSRAKPGHSSRGRRRTTARGLSPKPPRCPARALRSAPIELPRRTRRACSCASNIPAATHQAVARRAGEHRRRRHAMQASPSHASRDVVAQR